MTNIKPERITFKADVQQLYYKSRLAEEATVSLN